MRNFHFGVHFDVVSRSRGMSAARRAAYQSGGRARDGNGRMRSYSLGGEEHQGHWILLPRNAPGWTMAELWSAAAAAEKQHNSQEARILDVQLPRGLSREHIPSFVESIFGIFIRAGLAVQVDAHSLIASDGQENIHLHGLISMRTLTAHGFSATKARAWNRIFQLDRGRTIRARLARSVNRRLEALGYDIRVDPRTNAARGLPAPNGRIPLWAFHSESAAAQKMRTDLAIQRELRRKLEAAIEALAIAEAELAAAEQEERLFEESIANDSPGDDAALEKFQLANVSDAEAQRRRRTAREGKSRIGGAAIPIGEIERWLTPERAEAALREPHMGVGAKRIAETFLRDPHMWDLVAAEMDLWSLYQARIELMAPVYSNQRPEPLGRVPWAKSASKRGLDPVGSIDPGDPGADPVGLDDDFGIVPGNPQR